MSRKLLIRATLALSVALGAAPLASVGFAPLAYGQNATTGALTGVVMDSTGAIVPGAQVSITDTATGAKIQVTANAAGRYTATLLKPSTYKVKAMANGLASSVTQVTVLVGQTPNLDLSVTPNSSNQTVTVSAQTAQLTDTQSPADITTLTEHQVENLPAPGGDITSVAYTAPGVVENTNTSSGGYGNFTVNGLPGVSNLFVLNGADDMDPFLNLNNSGSSNMTLGLQEIAEAAVVVNGYSAQYGRQAGAIEEWTTKSGSNHYHGALTYYYSGTNMNANDYFNNLYGVGRPHERSNQWGANIGGPIIKDKLFFFTDYEGLRYITPRTGVAAFPSPQLQAYTLANLQNTSPAALPYYRQLFSLYDASPNYLRATPVTNGEGSLQDGNDQLGCGTLAGTQYAPGQTFGTNVPCAVATEGQATNLNQEWLYTARVDWNVSDKQKLFGRFETDHGSQPTYTSFVSPQFNETSVQPSYNGQLNDTYSISPNITNQFIFSTDWYTAYFGPSNTQQALSYLPTYMSIDNGGTNSGAWGQAGIENYYPQGRNETMYQFVDDLTWTKGNHTLRFGYNFRRADISDYDAQANEYGSYFLYSLADFANGYIAKGSPSYYTQAFPNTQTADLALYNLGVYAQDEWQVTPRLKLTLGARFDRNGNPLCNNNCFAIYNQGSFPQAGATLDSSYDSVMAANQQHPFNNIEHIVFQPRFGFNYDVLGNGHTVVRGGVGIFEDNPAAMYVDYFFENFPQYYSANVYSGNITGPGVAGGAPMSAASSAAVLKAGYASGITPNMAMAQVANLGATFTPPNVTVGQNTFRTPKYVEFNLQVQQQLSRSDAIILNYSGNVGYDEMIYSMNANGAYDAGAGMPFADLPATSPDPRFSSAWVIKNDAHSNYNGATVTYRHVDTHGLTVDANYTYSHSLDDVSNAGNPFTPANYDSITGQIDPYNMRLNYASSDYDVRHSFNMDATYEEKFRFHNRYVNEAAAGWVVSGKAYWRSGMPFSIIDSALPGAVGGATMTGQILAEAINPATINRNCTSVTTPCVTASQFYSTPGNTLGLPAQNSFGNLGRNYFKGPRYADVDLTAAKHVVTWRTLDLEVGANAFNVFNHTNFLQPSNDVATGVGTIYATAGPATSPFGAAALGQGGRILQVFGKFTF